MQKDPHAIDAPKCRCRPCWRNELPRLLFLDSPMQVLHCHTDSPPVPCSHWCLLFASAAEQAEAMQAVVPMHDDSESEAERDESSITSGGWAL